jgi:hypothetical protein
LAVKNALYHLPQGANSEFFASSSIDGVQLQQASTYVQSREIIEKLMMYVF